MNDVERYFSSWTLTLQSYKQYVIESILKYQSSFLCSTARLFTWHYMYTLLQFTFLNLYLRSFLVEKRKLQFSNIFLLQSLIKEIISNQLRVMLCLN